MILTGHWFCSHCNDVVHFRKPSGRWDVRRGEECPVCKHHTADWITDAPKPLTTERAAFLFHQMKQLTK
jgi:hypothetical protein